MKRILLSLLLIVSLVNHSFSQALCGSDLIHNQKLKTDPVYREAILRHDEQLQQYIEKNKDKLKARTFGPEALYNIPVVVHVIHTGGPVGSIYNPTDVQIQNTLAYLNQVYAGTWPGTEGVGNIDLQFVLAQRDPNCNPTNGINRVNGSGVAEYVTGGVEVQTTNGAPELNVKNLSRWPAADYYNIWIVNRIDGNDGTSGTFVAGYAYFPGAGPLIDGTVMLATQMAPGSTTLPHEIGHAFNLFHVFQSYDASCPLPFPPGETNCVTQGDRCCDTDPVTIPPGFACRTGNNTCTMTPYSINTEHNYMNYVSNACTTLFTGDQKTRVLASAGIAPRLSLSTSLGGTPTTDATNPCPPKINFQITDDTKTETTTSTSGCRGYTDYNYNMVIGNNPSATATATLNVSAGTALEGVDFDVTTNGNFASPSKVLTFPLGSTALQPFTIRVYDDASIEVAETFTFSFSVNPNGGNAVAGDGRPNFTFTINDNDALPVVPGTLVNRKVGVNGGSVTLQSAFRGDRQRHRLQVLYTAAELSAVGATSGNITALTLNVTSKNSTQPFQGFTISMLNSAATSFSNFIGGAFTQVYTSNYSTSVGDNTFAFGTGGGSSSAFAWDGTSSIVVQFCYDNGVSPTDPAADGLEAQGNATALSVYSNWTTGPGVGCTLPGAFLSSNRLNSTFTFALAGNPIVTTLTSKSAYLGPNSDVFFYSNSGETMARIINLGSHDYGCTQVEVDRVGSTSVPFWNNNPANYLMSKTLRVLPTTNNPSGSYQIRLYYSQAEVNGWQTATGQTFNNIQLIKVAGQISSVTPGNPTGGGAVNVITPSTGTFGTGSTITATLSNGFSGFGAGVAGFALPVKLIDFTGRLEKNSVVLNWKTTFEQNSKGFDIERSYDGNNFTSIGFVPSAGNSNISRAYSFKDQDVAQQINYYRLRQLDLDNQFEYSKVVTIKNASGLASPFVVMNNPFNSSIDLQFSQIPAGKVRIRLMDIAGRTVQAWDKNNLGLSRTRLNTPGSLQAGTYILEVRANSQVYVEKVIKQ